MPSIKTIKIIIAAAMFIGCVVFFGLWRYTALELKNERVALKTANATIEAHEKNKLITEEVANEYQSTITSLNADIKRLQQRPVRCHALASTPRGIDASTTETKLLEGNGIRSDWLYDFAGRCEAERLKVIGLQNFVNRLYND